MTDDTDDDLPMTQPKSRRRRTIPATCAPHRGPVGFTTLVVSTRGGRIELGQHTADAREVTLGEDGIRVLRSALTGWLR
ncbi:MAG: hypothetical protein JO063_01315 [Pseudonocardiales bacterium]|nr:hypothetical protein [Pseudonocardiales bacterium]MBV9029618.1 hypothetical protein [Pseudonocardiales bacterium]MBW0008753.1 hypothetical protein [Pseudonocardiales bacterium]